MLGLHHLITVPGASVVIGAASVQQARICFERMEGFISFPDLEDLVASVIWNCASKVRRESAGCG